MLACRLNQGDCALLMTDSSTSAGWLPTRPTSGRSSAMTWVASNLKFASKQHNITPPSSSKRASRSTPNGSQEKRTMLPTPSHVILVVQLVNCLTKIFCKTCTSQLRKHFQIAPLPNKISSWLTALLLKLPMQEQLREAHTRTKLGCGTV